jgi:hypothetical protein
MARMLPSYIDKSCKSKGEKIIFDLLEKSPFTSGWTVLHSLNLSEHATRLFGEIDFLLLIPGGGIFIVEVKGGDVRSIDGTWHFINKSGYPKRGKSPFVQGLEAMFSLKAAIKKQFGSAHKFNRLQYGFCVAFPEINFDIPSVEYQPWQVFDKLARENSPEQFFENLLAFTTEKHRGQEWFSDESLPSAEELNELCDFFRGDFYRLRAVQERLEEFDSNVKVYTREQFTLLDSIRANERSLISGSAGTGKTMIALESAVRAAMEGKKVFLTCYNRLVGQWMQKQLGEWNERITVSSLHSYMEKVSKGFDHDRSAPDFFTTYMPELLKNIFDKGIEGRFDKLIIDEGQDLIRQEYLNLFDAMLTGGLAEGEWEIYGDFERQAIFSQLSKLEMLAMIRGFSTPVNFVLNINCRNTREIGEETTLLSGFEKPPFLLEHLTGIAVDYQFYKDENDRIQKLTAILKKLKEEGLKAHELVLLSPRRFESSIPGCITGFKITELKVMADAKVKESIGFSTIQAYKGMESNYVILTDLEDLTSDVARSLLYVGMTRAKYALIMMIHESAREQYKAILINKLK